MKRRLAMFVTFVLVISSVFTVLASENPDKGVPYIEYYAEQTGCEADDIDLSTAASLSYSIQECEFGYPVQHIDDDESIQAAIDFFQNIYVTGEPDGVFSTEGGQGLSLIDKDGNTIISIFVQAGMIDTSEGRCEAEGLSRLSDIPGLMTPGDWNEYYAQQEQGEEEYREEHELSYPCTMFEAEGKEAFDFYSNCSADDINSIRFFYNGKNKTAMEKEEIEKIYESLCNVKVTGPGEASRWDDQWSVTIFYTPEGSTFQSDIHFLFRKGVLSADDEGFELAGLEGILDAYDWEGMELIAEMLSE